MNRNEEKKLCKTKLYIFHRVLIFWECINTKIVYKKIYFVIVNVWIMSLLLAKRKGNNVKIHIIIIQETLNYTIRQ